MAMLSQAMQMLKWLLEYLLASWNALASWLSLATWEDNDSKMVRNLRIVRFNERPTYVLRDAARDRPYVSVLSIQPGAAGHI